MTDSTLIRAEPSAPAAASALQAVRSRNRFELKHLLPRERAATLLAGGAGDLVGTAGLEGEVAALRALITARADALAADEIVAGGAIRCAS